MAVNLEKGEFSKNNLGFEKLGFEFSEKGVKTLVR